MNAPHRRTLSPPSASARLDDLAGWRRWILALRDEARARGISVQSATGGHGPASWALVRMILTLRNPPDWQYDEPLHVEIIPMADADAPFLARQLSHDRRTGPNHSGATVADALDLAAALLARPFDRDRCAHCGATSPTIEGASRDSVGSVL